MLQEPKSINTFTVNNSKQVPYGLTVAVWSHITSLALALNALINEAVKLPPLWNFHQECQQHTQELEQNLKSEKKMPQKEFDPLPCKTYKQYSFQFWQKSKQKCYRYSQSQMLLSLWREEMSPPRREVTTVHSPALSEVSSAIFITIVFAGEKERNSGT